MACMGKDASSANTDETLTAQPEVTSTEGPSPLVTLRFLASPTDVLYAGGMGVHGGRVLEWIDKAAYACAVGWSQS